MDYSFLGTIFTGVVSILSVLIANRISNEKLMADIRTENKVSQATTQIEIENLKKEVEKHNNVVERTYKLEERVSVLEERQKVANHRIQDMEGLN